MNNSKKITTILGVLLLTLSGCNYRHNSGTTEFPNSLRFIKYYYDNVVIKDEELQKHYQYYSKYNNDRYYDDRDYEMISFESDYYLDDGNLNSIRHYRVEFSCHPTIKIYPDVGNFMVVTDGEYEFGIELTWDYTNTKFGTAPIKFYYWGMYSVMDNENEETEIIKPILYNHIYDNCVKLIKEYIDSLGESVWDVVLKMVYKP